MSRDNGIRARLYVDGFRLNRGPESVRVAPQRAVTARYLSDLSGIEDGPDPYDGHADLLKKSTFSLVWPPLGSSDYLKFERLSSRGGYFDFVMWKRRVVRFAGPTRTLSQFGDAQGFTLPFRPALDFLDPSVLPTSAASIWPTLFWLNGNTAAPVGFTVRGDLTDAAGRTPITNGPELLETDYLEAYLVPDYLVRVSDESSEIASARNEKPTIVFEEG